MQQQAKTESADLCPKCGHPMAAVHFVLGSSALTIFRGQPPVGIVADLKEAATFPVEYSESGKPLLLDAGVYYPGMHRKHCRQVNIRYDF